MKKKGMKFIGGEGTWIHFGGEGTWNSLGVKGHEIGEGKRMKFQKVK